MIFLRVPAVLAYRDLVTRAVETVCKIATAPDGSRLPLGDEVVVEVVSAVGEAFNNAVLHAYEGTGRGEVSLEIEEARGALEITMIDEGKSFDIDAVPAPDLASLPESGMGLYIIRAFVDDVSYEPGPPNVLRMRKHLGPR